MKSLYLKIARSDRYTATLAVGRLLPKDWILLEANLKSRRGDTIIVSFTKVK